MCAYPQDTEESGWSRVGALAAAGACPCWCASWAEVRVRSPAGDVCWLMRMQNQVPARAGAGASVLMRMQ